MSRDLSILRELTESARTAGALGGGRGRYARTPDYAASSHPSSRPRSDRGATFHFKHSTISKGRSIAEGNTSQTHSAAHQGYIERPSASEKSTPDIAAALAEKGLSRNEATVLHPGFRHPERVVDPARISFGTTGLTKAERKAFWNDVEACEGRRARVQCRIIAELPAELDPLDRALIARDFCEEMFESRGLPYWACLHAPSKGNDPRNNHLHIAYFDRPSGRDANRRWDFSVLESKRMRVSGNIRTHRPYRNAKHPETRLIGWVRNLRTQYADTCNFYLSMSGQDKRHDPRSYKESGIAKEPTEHMGNKLSALEGFGLETEKGKRNARREIRWRIAQAEHPWMRRAEALSSSVHLRTPEMEDIRDHLYQIASRGITTARKSASYDIASALLTHRYTRRKEFLETEIPRLSNADDISRMTEAAPMIAALRSEAALIESRAQRIAELSRKCTQQAMQLSRIAERDGRDFDRLITASDPEVLFLDADADGFRPIDDLTPEAPEERDDPFAELTVDEMEDINDFLGSEDVPPESKDAPKKAADKAEADLSIDESHSEKAPAETRPMDRGTPEQFGLRRQDPIERIIGRLAAGDSLAEPGQGGAPQVSEDFPGAWPIAHPKNDRDVAAIDASLKELDNRSLRQTAIANRDATDLCAPGQLREDLNRGWVVLRFEAERRGVDLDTGVHDPARAKDPERATLHADQDPCPIRVVQKNIARQRVRG